VATEVAARDGAISRLSKPPADFADCYEEMRRIARRVLTSASDRHLLQPTELAHEAAIRLLALDSATFECRAHMLAIAARITRRALIDEARASRAKKRQTPSLLTLWPGEARKEVLLEDLDEALVGLAAVSADHARIVELRFMLGLTVDEAAVAEGIAPRTVKRRWAAARAWLQQRLEANEGD
jgi:RNA polymerase sigma factor (TIGR02999 family)